VVMMMVGDGRWAIWEKHTPQEETNEKKKKKNNDNNGYNENSAAVIRITFRGCNVHESSKQAKPGKAGMRSQLLLWA
jgi:hypothetical protein